MRADKRSFSFTWMRGQKNNDSSQAAETHAPMERSNTTWFMTTASSSSSSSGVSSMTDSSSVNSASLSDNGKENTSLRSESSMGKLRRLGSSFTRFGTKYSIIEDVDENQGQEDTEEESSPAPPQPFGSKVVQPEAKGSGPEPMHFDEDGKFIGRHGKQGSARKSSSTKDSGSGSGTKSFGRKLNRTVQEVKTSIGNFSQKFRRSTRRRYRMGPGTPLTDVTPTRKILGRTPTKLYSPFGIGFESPAFKTPKRLERVSTPRLTRKSLVSGLVYSPSNNFRQDLAEARRGMEDFHILSRDITRKSVRF